MLIPITSLIYKYWVVFKCIKNSIRRQRKSFQRVLLLSPKNERSHFYLARLYMRMQDYPRQNLILIRTYLLIYRITIKVMDNTSKGTSTIVKSSIVKQKYLMTMLGIPIKSKVQKKDLKWLQKKIAAGK